LLFELCGESWIRIKKGEGQVWRKATKGGKSQRWRQPHKENRAARDFALRQRGSFSWDGFEGVN
jgi:hypothetical protein